MLHPCFRFALLTISGNIEVGGKGIFGGWSNWQSFGHYGSTASSQADPLKDLDQGSVSELYIATDLALRATKSA